MMTLTPTAAPTGAPLPVATSAISVEPGARPAAALPSAAGAGGRNDLRSLAAKRPARKRRARVAQFEHAFWTGTVQALAHLT